MEAKAERRWIGRARSEQLTEDPGKAKCRTGNAPPGEPGGSEGQGSACTGAGNGPRERAEGTPARKTEGPGSEGMYTQT